MDTVDHESAPVSQARFCPKCGQAAAEANFCPGCGHNMGFAADRTIADPALADPAVKRARPGGSSRPRVAALVACAALGIAAIAVAVFVITSNSSSKASGSNATTTYKHQLARALRPLAAANTRLSLSLTALDSSASTSQAATRDASAARAALNTANGAVGTLSAPSSEPALAGQVKQALSAENGWLQAVSSTLQTPSGSGAGQLQTLATGAQTALVALDGVLPNVGSSVSGASGLASWAHAQAARQSKAASKAPAPAASSAPTTVTTVDTVAGPTVSSGAPVASGSGGASATNSVSCGDDLFGGPHTSCPFAENVQQAYENSSGGSNEVTAYSPVTGDSYTEQCGPDDAGGIECVGVGNPSSVTWGN